MSEDSRREVRTGLDRCLARLWRYALVLTGRSDTAEELVQVTCLQAVERADQFVPGTRLDRWLFAILRSIWLNEIRARRISEGGGFIDAEGRLRTDGEKAVETNIPTTEMFKAIGPLPGAERETVLLVYGEGYSYAEAASTLGIPIDTVISRLVAARSTLVTPSSASLTTSRCRYGNRSKNLMNYPIRTADLVFLTLQAQQNDLGSKALTVLVGPADCPASQFELNIVARTQYFDWTRHCPAFFPAFPIARII